MTYLSRFELNRGRRGTQQLLASPQRMHAAVMAAFTSADHAAAGRLLWRVDRSESVWHLYVVSPATPDFTHLVEQAGWPTKPQWSTRDYEPFLTRLAVGQRWAFRLRANPSYVRTAGGTKKVRSHATSRHQLQWLLDRAARLGISISTATSGEPDVVVRDAARVGFARGAGAPVQIYAATYDGNLEVDDADALRTALILGVGRSKAYGCGLMTLVRA